MIRVERGNVVLHVPDDEEKHYLQLGYNVTDESGNVIRAAVPRDLGTLQQFFIEASKKIANLEAELAELRDKHRIDIVEQIEEENKAPARRGKKKTN